MGIAAASLYMKKIHMFRGNILHVYPEDFFAIFSPTSFCLLLYSVNCVYVRYEMSIQHGKKHPSTKSFEYKIFKGKPRYLIHSFIERPGQTVFYLTIELVV